MIWALVSRVAFSFDDWGTFSETFRDHIVSSQTGLPDLAAKPWFIRMLRSWPGEGDGQSDSSEFTQILLNGVSSQSISCAWERRLMQSQKICIADRGMQHTPLTLQIEPEQCLDNTLNLGALLRHWHTEYGMFQALTSASDLLCIHLDRFCQRPNGDLIKLDFPVDLEDRVDVPVFTSDALQVCWVSYTIVAATGHTGDVSRGHYTSLLRVDSPADTVGPKYAWLFVDDNRAMRPCWCIPVDFEATVTQLWLGRCIDLELHKFQGEGHFPVDPTTFPETASTIRARTHAMLQLLQSHP
eukprot:s4865_g2.t1